MRTHLDLFSGIGGFALAAQWNGLETIGFSEIEPYACKVLERHWPHVPNMGDIRNVRGFACHLLTGGFPCQPFSCAGKRRGTEDDRHLWPEMCRVIDEAKPTWVLAENVPGIIGMELDAVLSDLENIGYACWPVVVPACAVDARHRRDRVWIVAYTASRGGQRRRPAPGQAQGASGISSGPSKDVADAAQGRFRCGSASGNTGQPAFSSEALADARSGRQSGPWQSLNASHPEAAGQRQATQLVDGGEPCVWLPEPQLGRVAHGIPNRAHRLKGLGNAIVPQVAAQIIAMMIKASQITATR